jgi:hypothetical protein
MASKKPAELTCSGASVLALYFDPEDRGDILEIVNELHDLVSHNTELFHRTVGE